MKRIFLLSVIVLLFVGTSTTYAQGDALINSLTKELKVTPDQAMGGAGALFKYAKEALVSGASGFLSKPYNKREITDQLGIVKKNL